MASEDAPFAATTDGWVDLYVVNGYEAAPHHQDLYYRNLQNGTFAAVPGTSDQVDVNFNETPFSDAWFASSFRRGEKRCEIACLTAGGGWCSSMHYCGSANEDVAGLAEQDSVCVWAGE